MDHHDSRGGFEATVSGMHQEVFTSHGLEPEATDREFAEKRIVRVVHVSHFRAIFDSFQTHFKFIFSHFDRKKLSQKLSQK